MYLGIDKIGNELELQGYKCFETGKMGVVCLWKSKNGDQKVVIVVDTGYKDIKTKTALNRIVCHAEGFRGLKKNNVLIVLVGSGKFLKVNGYNIVRVNPHTWKCLAGIYAKEFKIEVEKIRIICKKEKINNEIYENALGPINCGHNEWMAWVLIVINIYCFFKTYIAGNGMYGISPETVYGQNETYRILTYMFMHNGIRHILSNMVSLFVIGRILANRVGSLDMLAVYLFGGCSGAFMSMWHSIEYEGDIITQTVGASGAIFGVLGALIVDVLMDPDNHVKTSVIKYGVVVFILSSIGLNIDIMCHLGGLIGGAAMMFLLNESNEIWSNLHSMRAYGKKTKIANRG